MARGPKMSSSGREDKRSCCNAAGLELSCVARIGFKWDLSAKFTRREQSRPERRSGVLAWDVFLTCGRVRRAVAKMSDSVGIGCRHLLRCSLDLSQKVARGKCAGVNQRSQITRML